MAVIVNRYGPPEPAAGVPASVAVPSPLSVNFTPVGSAPVSDNAALGTPVDLTVKVPAWPTVKVVPAGLVNAGAWLTVRVKLWVAAEPTPFVAVIVNLYGPAESAAGIPESAAEPSPLSVNMTPDGSLPDSDKPEVGTPVDLTVKAQAMADSTRGVTGTGDPGRLENGEGEGLGVRTDTVRGGDREQVHSAGTRWPVFPQLSPCRPRCR